jgi:hypothetical protein
VTVSAADSPQEHQVAVADPRLPRTSGGETMLLSETPPVIPAVDYDRDITLDGVPIHVPKRAVVLVFTPTSWAKTGEAEAGEQTVSVSAVDDTLAEGERVVVSSHSVISDDPVFDHAIVRNVEVTIHDDDQPAILVTQLDPTTTGPAPYGHPADDDSIALEGTAVTEETDLYAIELATMPTSGAVTIAIKPGDSELWLESADSRFVTDSAVTANAPGVYHVSFDASDWSDPVLVSVHARDDFATEDAHNTPIIHSIDPDPSKTTDADYRNAAGSASDERIDVRVLDDEKPGMLVLESAGKTQVSAGDTTSGPGPGDSYTVRLNSEPTTDVKVAIVTDGQTDVTTGGRISLEAIGRLESSELFNGNLLVSGSVITRATGSELGSFASEGFAAGQLIRISGAGAANGDYTVASVSSNGKQMTLATSPAAGTFNGAAISRLIENGLYTGDIAYTTGTHGTDGATLTRTDGSSWLDSGFLEGQLIQISGLGGATGTYKINTVSGTTSDKLDVLTLRANDILPSAGSGTLTITEWAAVVEFTGKDDVSPNWYQKVTVPVLADPWFELAPGRENLKAFPKQEHVLGGIRGPLAVEGGTTAADRSLKEAILLPGEANGPLFQVAAQPPESHQIDTLNVFSDDAGENLEGTLTSTALTGLNMGSELTFPVPPGGMPFGEPSTFPGGISYGSIVVDPVTGAISQDSGVSTVEVVNILLGEGNDRLSIESTLVPGPDQNADGSLGTVSTAAAIRCWRSRIASSTSIRARWCGRTASPGPTPASRSASRWR